VWFSQDHFCCAEIPAAPVPKLYFIDCAQYTAKKPQSIWLAHYAASPPATPEAGRWCGSALGLIVVGGFWCGCRLFYSVYD